MADLAPPEIRTVPVEHLRLDDRNPRLPERLRGSSQPEILGFLHQQGVLEELAQSYMDNGFFPNEPLIVVRENGAERHTVIEGNRRLAALEILHDLPAADGLHFIGIEPSEAQLDGLREIPCFLVPGRERVHAYIGFRHIGGIKTWPPEAKARYILAEVRQLAQEGSDDPFRELGRRVGSNAQGMRSPYLAIRILLHAREEFGLDVSYVQESRFGVWLRCMSSADIRQYIGLGRARAYPEIEAALAGIDAGRLKEVIEDLGRRTGGTRAVLGDSRDITVYGRVIGDKRARATLRKTGDLSLAKQIVDELDLEPRARRLAESIKLFLDTLLRAENADITADLLAATGDLSHLGRSAVAIVKGRMDDRDTEP